MRHSPPTFEFGPYKTPRFRFGAIVTCELRGDVRIDGITDARIPWPRGRVIGKRGNASYVIYKDLAKALRRETSEAIQFWFGMGHHTVTELRRLLGVPRTTEAQRRIMSRHGKSPERRAQLAKGWAKAGGPVRLAKMRAALCGKPRPKHIIEALRRGRYKGGPANAGKPWSKREDALLHLKLAAKVIGERIGRTEVAVLRRRSELRAQERSEGAERPTARE